MKIPTTQRPGFVQAICCHSLLSLLLLTLVGCATSDTRRQPQGLTVWPEPPPDGQSLLFFYTQRRDTLRNQPTIYVDDQMVFTLHADAYSWCYVKPGFHTVKADWQPYRWGLNMEKRFLFTPGATIYLRLSTNVSGKGSRRLTFIHMDPIDPVIAKLNAERSTYTPPVTTQVGLP